MQYYVSIREPQEEQESSKAPMFLSFASIEIILWPEATCGLCTVFLLITISIQVMNFFFSFISYLAQETSSSMYTRIESDFGEAEVQ